MSSLFYLLIVNPGCNSTLNHLIAKINEFVYVYREQIRLGGNYDACSGTRPVDLRVDLQPLHPPSSINSKTQVSGSSFLSYALRTARNGLLLLV